jgi:hypothetical protein
MAKVLVTPPSPAFDQVGHEEQQAFEGTVVPTSMLGHKPDKVGQCSQEEFENKIRAEIRASLRKQALEPLKIALFARLGKLPNLNKQPDEDLVRLIELWWDQDNPIERIEILHEATENCLRESEQPKNLTRIRDVYASTQQMIAWLALACVSQEWVNLHYDEQNPYHEIPLWYITGIELFTACIKGNVLVGLYKPSKTSEIIGERLLDLGKHGYLPESGWPPEKAVEEAAKALWKSEINPNIPVRFEPQDYSRLRYILTQKNKYLALDRSMDKSHPFFVGEVCKLFQDRFKGVSIVYFGVVNIKDCVRPLIVDEGTLLGAVQLFLEMIEKYEHP